jgi:hypothetical protein
MSMFHNPHCMGLRCFAEQCSAWAAASSPTTGAATPALDP